MNKIIKKCCGLPMAIISIAGLLVSYRTSESKEMWERVRKSIGTHMESRPTLEGMKQIISLSYNHLHHYLKGCMMYLSFFPEDYVIVKNRLLKRWIAEGLVAEIQGLTLMEVADIYYNELVRRSMIDRADDIISWRDGKVETCRVHNMVYEVMVSKALDENFISLVGGPYEGMSYGRIRRLSIHGGEEVASIKTATSHGRKNAIKEMKMEHVRSLSVFDLNHIKVLDRLGEFSLLRVLDLEDCMGLEDKHLVHVCRMYMLRFLGLKGTYITNLPPEVGGLENLETLDVRDLRDLPKTVSKLEKLEHLQISNKEYTECWIARKGLGRMKALRMVNTIVFARSLSKMYSLRWLSIGSKVCRDNDTLDFLHDLDMPPALLQYLKIGAGINKLPNWISSLNNLVELVIAWTYFVGDQLFGPICKLPRLKYLRLGSDCYKDTELVAQTAHTFPALKYLFLNFNIESMEAVRFEENTMTELETLSVSFWKGELNRVQGMKNLASLQEVQLAGQKGNPALDCAMEQLKTLNEKRPGNQMKVAVQYQ
ncbi:disease resistance protein Pik-2-like [Triticum dicoccoides]|uniref:disease resistance protein Pik-2-like n=1 Tax=Triticum dicoccoides TaxID=85692 RepID=UPI00189065D1|nr:disease resistance protein Pik-2-like [Triticum dicoccoides]